MFSKNGDEENPNQKKLTVNTMTSPSQFRQEALQALRGKWNAPAICTLIYIVITIIICSILGGIIAPLIISILFLNPLAWGYNILLLKNLRSEAVSVNNLFDGFRDYTRITGTMALVLLYTFLWTLLLIIPGIIKTYSYAMTSFILNDNPDTGLNVAIEESMDMMNGHKMELFLLDLSFIGWYILGILSLGIGFIWITPYQQTARAAFYEELKVEYYT